MPARAELLLCLLLVGTGLAHARDPQALPDGGFLEFLGMMLEEDGGYLDPLDLADTAPPGQLNSEAAAENASAPRMALPAGDAAENDDADH